MDEKIKKELDEEVHTQFHQTMLEDSKALVDMSRGKMQEYYDQWNRNDDTYRGVRYPDKEDKQASARKEPEKIVVPVSHAQIEVFVAFCFSLFFQRERFYELNGMSEEDHVGAKIGEALLQRDLTVNVAEQKIYQLLLDVGRFGLGIVKTCWTRETQRVRVMQETAPLFQFLGIKIGGGDAIEVEQDVTKYLGNKIANVSPFKFFPDTRLPLTRFQEGEFVASEEEYSLTTLRQMEYDGEVAGIEHVKAKEGADGGKNNGGSRMHSAGGQTLGTVTVTEVQRVIVPSKYEIEGKPLSEETRPTKYLIWYANGNRVIKCEPLGYLHGDFTYNLTQLSPDQHTLLNEGLSDIVDQLQSVISWFLNSRITNVRKVIGNHLVVDPQGVNMQDVAERNPIIRLKPMAGARGIDRWIKQLDVSDVTARHVEDVKFLHEWVQTTTGISESLLGQFHGGRRSATEARNVYSGAANRLKMTASLIFRTALEPMGRHMLSNLRDGLDEEATVKVVGLDRAMQGVGTFMKVDKRQLAGSYDFEVFDGTLPSEKAVIAQTLEQTLMGFMKNPEAMIAMGIDPKAVWLEVLELRGVRNPERFTLRMPPGGITALPAPPPGGGGGEGAGPQEEPQPGAMEGA